MDLQTVFPRSPFSLNDRIMHYGRTHGLISWAIEIPIVSRGLPVSMPTCIIFHSYSGITRGIAEKIEKACGGRLIEVVPRKAYNKLTVYLAGGRRAMKGEADPVDPERIDVAACDLLVIGTPVWAGNPTPVINGAIAGLANCEGKSAVLFATCGVQAGKTLEVMTRALETKGVVVKASIVFSRKEIGDEKKVQELVDAVKTAQAAGP